MCLQILSVTNLFIIIVVAVQAIGNSVDGNVLYENEDLYKIKTPTRFHLFEVLRHTPTPDMKTAGTQKFCSIDSHPIKESTHIKKWQVGRVSRKQYEIINMLWRKTKNFADVSASSYRPGNPFLKLPPRPNSALKSSTPSFIEFYYLDESNDKINEINQKHQSTTERKELLFKTSDIFMNGITDIPIYAFRNNDSNITHLALSTKNIHSSNKIIYKTKTRRQTATSNSVTPKNILNRVPYKSTAPNGKGTIINHFSTRCAQSPKTIKTFNIETISNYSNSDPISVIHHNWPTTIYDRIKFFEKYDKNTPLPYNDERRQLLYMDDVEIVINGNKINNEQKNVLEDIDKSIRNQPSKRDKSSYVKTHIIEDNKYDSKNITEDNKDNSKDLNLEKRTMKPSQLNTTIIKSNNKRNLPSNESHFSESKPKTPENILNKVAVWADYSFMAAYIYEPSQVHCDAAGISPHWLITSGSCLSRHHKIPGGEGRSAFVAYCGSTWWNTERIAYVKFSIVHPHYHQRDMSRRYLYNIGLIQVVISMSTCYGWAPVSLMSHQLIIDAAGSTAHAIGWGLDRYDTRYASASLPKYPLMKYESKVFSDVCPGNIGYSQEKRMSEGSSVKNVYCLSLPPYLGEETDPIHGSMLIIGGKLVAIYLQEERRRSGDQSAEYTGIWRLGPWVSRVAREPDDGEPFAFAM